MTTRGRAVLLALALGGVGSWGCGDGSASTPIDPAMPVDPAVPVDDAPVPSSSGASATTVESIVQPQAVATAKLLRVAPQHVQAVQQGLAQRLSRSSEVLKVHVANDGTKSMRLEGRFGHVLIANQDEAGKTQVQCAGSQEEVAKALGN